MPDELPSLANECFFIAPIGLDGTSERQRSDGVLHFIVDRAAQELGLTAVRADQIADPGQITRQVIDHILGARGAVADVTDLNPNVFYELAIRHTAQLPVVIIAEKDCRLPFDIAQMRTIFFQSNDLQSADQCRVEIVAQLRRALDGAIDSPITASVDVRALSGGSAADEISQNIVTTIENVARSQYEIIGRIDKIESRSSIRTSQAKDYVNPSAVSDLIKAWRSALKIARKQQDEELISALQEQISSLSHIANRVGVEFSVNDIWTQVGREIVEEGPEQE